MLTTTEPTKKYYQAPSSTAILTYFGSPLTVTYMLFHQMCP